MILWQFVTMSLLKAAGKSLVIYYVINPKSDKDFAYKRPHSQALSPSF